MPTPNGSLTSYLTPTEYLKRCDVRTVAKLCSDTDVPVDPSSLASDVNLAAALLDASGTLESALLAGDRYTTADLSALTGASQGTLFRVLAILTTEYLYRRRPNRDREPGADYQDAQTFLAALADGKRVFALQEVGDAGVGLTDYVETNQDIATRNLPSYQIRRAFGTRGNRRHQWGAW
jgi:hypothetical protein